MSAELADHASRHLVAQFKTQNSQPRTLFPMAVPVEWLLTGLSLFLPGAVPVLKKWTGTGYSQSSCQSERCTAASGADFLPSKASVYLPIAAALLHFAR